MLFAIKSNGLVDTMFARVNLELQEQTKQSLRGLKG